MKGVLCGIALAEAMSAGSRKELHQRSLVAEVRYGRCCAQLRSQAEVEALHATKAPAGKRYFHHTRLPEIIGAYPIKASADEGRERERRQAFLDFLLGVLVRFISMSVEYGIGAHRLVHATGKPRGREGSGVRQSV